MFKMLLNLLAVIVGAGLLGLAFFYWKIPAGALPLFVPGYAEGSTVKLREHSIASALLGIMVFALSWILSGAGKKKPMLPPDNLTAPEKLEL
jgi:hypothetical protein